MPDPISLTVAMLGIAGIQTFSQIVGGVAQQRTAKANAKELERRGRIAYEDVQRESEMLLGAQRARYAKAGVQTTSGTPLEVITATAEQEELRALRAAFDYTAEAAREKQRGKLALWGAIMGGAVTLLGKSSSMYSPDMIQGSTSTQNIPTSSFTGSQQLPATGGPLGGFGNIA